MIEFIRTKSLIILFSIFSFSTSQHGGKFAHVPGQSTYFSDPSTQVSPLANNAYVARSNGVTSFNYPKDQEGSYGAPPYQTNPQTRNFQGNNRNGFNDGPVVAEHNLPGGPSRQSVHHFGNEGGTLIQRNGGGGGAGISNQRQNAQYPGDNFNKENFSRDKNYYPEKFRGGQNGQPIVIEHNFPGGNNRQSVHYFGNEGGTLVQKNGGQPGNHNRPASQHYQQPQPANYPQQAANLPQQPANFPQQQANFPQQQANLPQQQANLPQQPANFAQQPQDNIHHNNHGGNQNVAQIGIDPKHNNYNNNMQG